MVQGCLTFVIWTCPFHPPVKSFSRQASHSFCFIRWSGHWLISCKIEGVMSTSCASNHRCDHFSKTVDHRVSLRVSEHWFIRFNIVLSTSTCSFLDDIQSNAFNHKCSFRRRSGFPLILSKIVPITPSRPGFSNKGEDKKSKRLSQPSSQWSTLTNSYTPESACSSHDVDQNVTILSGGGVSPPDKSCEPHTNFDSLLPLRKRSWQFLLYFWGRRAIIISHSESRKMIILGPFSTS